MTSTSSKLRSSKLRPLLALGAAAALLLSTGCSGGDAAPAPNEPSEPDRPYVTGAFGEIRTGTQRGDVFTVTKVDVPVPDPAALKEQWDAKANEEQQARADLYSFGNALFEYWDGNDFINSGSSSMTNAGSDVRVGGKASFNMACLATEPGTIIQVAIELGADDFIAADFECGHNELAEGTIKFVLPPNDGVISYISNEAVEGFKIRGVTMDAE